MIGTTNTTGSSIVVNKSLSISLNGSSATVYDGTTSKSINITASSVGAASSNHNHDQVYSKLGHNHDGTQFKAGQGASGGFTFVNDELYDTGMYSDIDGDLYFKRNGVKIAFADIGHNHDQVYAAKSHTHTKDQVGLGNVDNTADANKNVSSAYYIRGEYTGNGGKQPPSFIPSAKIRFMMSNDTGKYADWLLMDTYHGTDVPYVSAIGLEKDVDPCLWIMSGEKGGSSWIVKRRVPSFSTDIYPGQFLVADGNTGKIKTSGYSANSFASPNINTFNFVEDRRGVGTTPNDYNSILKLAGLKYLSVLGITTGTGTYAGLIGMRQWGDPSGGDSHELAFSDNNSIWSRAGATAGWGPWSLICCTNSKAVVAQSSAPSVSGIWAW